MADLQVDQMNNYKETILKITFKHC